MNLRDVPDDIYATLVEGAEASRQSLNAFVVDRLSEIAEVLSIAGYVRSTPGPAGPT
jgi:hypothetical protein